MYLDMTYIVLILPAVIFSLWASWNVKRTYKKYEKQLNSRGLTGGEAARRVLDANGLRAVPVECVSGTLTDHYDPQANVIRLSQSVYGSSSTRSDTRSRPPRAICPGRSAWPSSRRPTSGRSSRSRCC